MLLQNLLRDLRYPLVRVGYIQTNPVFGEVEYNVRHACDLIRRAQPADLLVLPELFNTGYLFVDRHELTHFAEPVPDGYTTQRLIEVARDTQTWIVAGLAERVEERIYNSAVVVSPSGFIGVYRKTHLFWNEKKLFAPGDTGFLVFDTDTARIGVMICFDWIFPEAARTLALRGADIICHPANLVLPYAPHAMLTRSIENRVFTITANRIGTEERGNQKLRFIGMSQITSPKMELLIRAPEDQEHIGVVDIDPSLARDKRVTPLNHIFEDRRPHYYLLT